MAQTALRQYGFGVDSLLPPDAVRCTDARAEAEALGDDAQLLRFRELETAHASLPPVIDGVRRSRLLDTDAISTTWEGWNLSGGERTVLRCIRPRWVDDPVMLRRMAEGPLRSSRVSWHSDGDWPHLRVVAEGAMIADRFPIEDAPETSRLARILGGGLAALGRIHDNGFSHGGPLATTLLEVDNRMDLVWMDPFDRAGTQENDLRMLASLVYALDPIGLDPVARLAAEWIEDPPLSAQDGIQLLERTLGGVLLSERHRLAVAGRSRSRLDRTSRLASNVRQLIKCTTPPQGRVCLKAGPDGLMVIAESDGHTVRGGAAAEAGGRFLPIVYTPDQGLDAQSARFLLRSWAMRAQGDEEERRQIQADLQTTDETASQLVRWLSSMARLRAAKLLLEASQAS